MELIFYVCFVGIFVLIIASRVVGVRRDRARTARLREWATLNGWSSVDDAATLLSTWQGEPFQDRCSLTGDAIVGRLGDATAVSFTLRTTSVGADGESTTATWHVVALTLPAQVPRLQLVPEGVGSWLDKTFGAQDVQVGDRVVDAAFRIEATDPRFVHDLFDPVFRAAVLSPGVVARRWRLEGSSLVMWNGGAATPERTTDMAGAISTIIGAVPARVWQTLGVRPPRVTSSLRPLPGPAGGRLGRKQPAPGFLE